MTFNEWLSTVLKQSNICTSGAARYSVPFLYAFSVFLQTLFLTSDQVLQFPESLYLAARWAVQLTGKAQVCTN